VLWLEVDLEGKVRQGRHYTRAGNDS
jgi:hypothetical protein